MTQISTSYAVAGLVLAALFVGCSHKVDAKTELEKTAGLLAQTEVAQPPPTAAPEAQPAMPPDPASTAEPAAAVVPPSKQMQQALNAFKSGELEDAVTRLQKLRATTTLTAQQRMAVQDSVAAVMLEIYELASKGDSKAIQAVKQYEEMQTSRQ